jgi:hypothetical protein
MHKTPHRKALGALNANSSSPFPTLQQAHQKLSKRYNPYPSPCTSTTAKSSPVSLYRSALLDLVLGPDDVVLVGRKAPSAAELARHGCNRYHLLSGRALVSRTHAMCVTSSYCRSVLILGLGRIRPRSMTVLGQNGIRVDGQHVGKGETVDLPSDRSMLEVDFHDATLLVHLAPLNSKTADQNTPPGTPAPLETSDVEMEAEEGCGSSDLSDAEEEEEEEREEPAGAEATGQEGPHLESLLALGEVDLVGLIASTLVFSTRTTVSPRKMESTKAHPAIDDDQRGYAVSDSIPSVSQPQHHPRRPPPRPL